MNTFSGTHIVALRGNLLEPQMPSFGRGGVVHAFVPMSNATWFLAEQLCLCNQSPEATVQQEGCGLQPDQAPATLRLAAVQQRLELLHHTCIHDSMLRSCA